ncbi:MAG: hypothetical protein ACREIB_05250, partial [Pseudomonadota bacterium]
NGHPCSSKGGTEPGLQAVWHSEVRRQNAEARMVGAEGRQPSGFSASESEQSKNKIPPQSARKVVASNRGARYCIHVLF